MNFPVMDSGQKLYKLYPVFKPFYQILGKNGRNTVGSFHFELGLNTTEPSQVLKNLVKKQ
jgi:hypothetical protein